MNMIQKLILGLLASAAFTVSAQENLIKYGDFENLPAGRVNMVKNMQKSGVDINRDPMALTPGWYSKKGKISIQIVDAKADKTAVKSGNGALNIKGAHLHLYTGQMFTPGTYELSFAHKGKGQVHIVLYFYSAKNKHLGNSSAKAIVKPGKDWQTFSGKITISPEKKDTAKARLVFVFVNSDISVDDIVLKSVK